MRIQAKEAHHQVGGNAEELDKGAGDDGHRPQHADNGEGQAFRFLHGDALGYQLTQHQGEIRHNQRNDHHADRFHRPGIAGGRGHRSDKPVGQRFRQRLSGGGGGQKAGQRHADLDGGKKVGGIRGKLQDLLRFFVPVLRHFPDLCIVEGNDRDLRCGKKRVDENQDQQEQQLQPYLASRIRVCIHGNQLPLSLQNEAAAGGHPSQPGQNRPKRIVTIISVFRVSVNPECRGVRGPVRAKRRVLKRPCGVFPAGGFLSADLRVFAPFCTARKKRGEKRFQKLPLLIFTPEGKRDSISLGAGKSSGPFFSGRICR